MYQYWKQGNLSELFKECIVFIRHVYEILIENDVLLEIKLSCGKPSREN